MCRSLCACVRPASEWRFCWRGLSGLWGRMTLVAQPLLQLTPTRNRAVLAAISPLRAVTM